MGSRLRDQDDRRRPSPWWIGALAVLAVVATWRQMAHDETARAQETAAAHPAAAPDIEAILLDVSDSSTPADRCHIARAVAAEAVLRDDAVELQLWATGHAGNGQHAELVDAAELPRARPGHSVQETRAIRRERAQELVAACEALTSRRVSPVAGAVEDVLHGLATRCRHPATCRLHVRTDGLETHDPELRRRLQGDLTAPVTPRFDNADVDVTLCDLTDVVVPPGGHSPTLAEVRAAWAPLFVAPGRVSFLPACPGAGR